MGAYDPETLNVLRSALDQAWALLPDERKAVTFKADMADRILKRAAEGERDPVKLRVAALIGLHDDVGGVSAPRRRSPPQSESNADRGRAEKSKPSSWILPRPNSL